MIRPIPPSTDDDTMRRALEQADPLALRAAVMQLTGDEEPDGRRDDEGVRHRR